MKPGEINTELEEMKNRLSDELFDLPLDQLGVDELAILDNYMQKL